MTIVAEPLTGAAFAPYGHVFARPPEFGRHYESEALANGRKLAKPSLSFSRSRPLETTQLTALKMERHEFSSQSFIPIEVSRYLIVVAPHGANGQPDASRLKAFVARGDQGITYGMNVWHHPSVVLDRPALFAVWMWLDSGVGDEEFVDLPAPVTITFPLHSS